MITQCYCLHGMSTMDTIPALIKYWLLQIDRLNGYESSVLLNKETLNFLIRQICGKCAVEC